MGARLPNPYIDPETLPDNETMRLRFCTVSKPNSSKKNNAVYTIEKKDLGNDVSLFALFEADGNNAVAKWLFENYE